MPTRAVAEARVEDEFRVRGESVRGTPSRIVGVGGGGGDIRERLVVERLVVSSLERSARRFGEVEIDGEEESRALVLDGLEVDASAHALHDGLGDDESESVPLVLAVL